MIVFRLAWRNIWRNRARTAIAGGAIALNTAILIVTVGLTKGMLDKTVESLTSMAIGQAQVHAELYRAERSLNDTVSDPGAIRRAAARASIASVSRAYGPGLASVGNKSSGALFWGVSPLDERRAFELPKQVLVGHYLSDSPPAAWGNNDAVREVVLGRKLAKALDARVGSQLVAVVQARDGSIGNELFAVVGILKSVSSDIDASAAIVRQQDYEQLFVAPGAVHEVALTSHGRLSPEAVVAAVRTASAHNELLSWKELAPGPAQMLGVFSSVMGILGLIFGLTAGSSVMNSMLMSTFDRLREFGVIKALGGTAWRIVRDVVSEAALMGLLFGTLGAGLGVLANTYLEHHGLDLHTGDHLALSGIAFDPVWRASQSPGAVVGSVALMFVVSIVAALYPALKVARLDPVIAMTEP
ncbi:MAG: ABC transporter permease [Polyangiaceae bacterium]|nr:ABC transporter permease [Polyangiaceae bacterium]